MLRIGAEWVQKLIGDLDVISRDDLEERLGREKLEAIEGYMGRLRDHATNRKEAVQRLGSPRELAEERWTQEVAEIYENAFGKKASVSGSSTKKTSRGPFYKLLEVSLPSSFLRHGKLSPRQVNRVLKRRD